jgi:hypothetical protein
MPCKERHVIDERLRFVARPLKGEKMAPLCPSSGLLARRATRVSAATRDGGQERLAHGHRQGNAA